MKITILSLFPDEISTFIRKGILKRALEKGLFELSTVNIRDYSKTSYKQVDDYPFAHKTGMLLKADVLYEAITSQPNYKESKILYPCPKGVLYSHEKAAELSHSNQDIIIIVGYYEGIDDRLLKSLPIQSISLGDTILLSGELPAMLITESIVRYIPGVVGNKICVENDSVLSGLLEYPQYTQPVIFNDMEVPPILRSGNHQQIKQWERGQSLESTLFKRPDLIIKNTMSKNDQENIVDILTK